MSADNKDNISDDNNIADLGSGDTEEIVDSVASSRKVIGYNNLYTVILALSTVTVFATAAFVTFKLYAQYGTIFKIIEMVR